MTEDPSAAPGLEPARGPGEVTPTPEPDGPQRERGWVEKKATKSKAVQSVVSTLDGEINYEDHPINWNARNGYFRDAEVRRQSYRTVFAGATGVTYGNQCVWQMYDTGRTPIAAR